MNELDTEAIKADIRKVLEGFDRRIFVRGVENDTNPKWMMTVMPYLAALANLQRWAK